MPGYKRRYTSFRYNPLGRTLRRRHASNSIRLTDNLMRARRRRRGTGRRVAKVARNVMMNLAENKVRDRADPVSSGALASYYHNQVYVSLLHDMTNQTEHLRPTSLAQGDENFQRNGREVYSTGFRVRGIFDIPFDRRNTTIKIYQFEANSSQGSITNEMFHTGAGSTGNKLLDRVNSEKFKGIKLLRTLRVKPRDLYVERGELTDAGSLATLKYDIWIPWKRKLTYKNAGGFPPATGAKEIMGLAFVFYDAAETLTTDAVSTRNEQLVSWYYKDP